MTARGEKVEGEKVNLMDPGRQEFAASGRKRIPGAP